MLDLCEPWTRHLPVMDWVQKQAFRDASEAAGASVRRAREARDDHGARTADEVRDLREQAARSATVCADCFQPSRPTPR